jgi:PAS domain S-box-containing protein
MNRASLQRSIERFFARFGWGMRAKLIILFVFIKAVPLIFLAVIAWNQAWDLGQELKQRTAEIIAKASQALPKTGNLAVNDAMQALDALAVENIEFLSANIADRVADFLYARDQDVLLAAGLVPDERLYRNFIDERWARIVKPGDWKLSSDGRSWQRLDPLPVPDGVSSSNAENSTSFRYSPPEPFSHERRPLYLEMTFVDVNGEEKIKVASSARMARALRNVADRRNTYVRAETYFQHLKALKPGEIYVSDVIGEYVGSRLVGVYTPENAAKLDIAYMPEESAYAGVENPVGRRFKGLVRWATPVVKKGEVIGYVTLALDHDHIMEFSARIVPGHSRYTDIPDASQGSYVYMWDYKGRNIVHPRHFFITGYDAQSGEPQVPWLEEDLYRQWQAGGQSYAEFIEDVPAFMEQSNDKKPSAELSRQGMIGLDCRYLNFSPQCTGWFDLTQNGGSGSFILLWNGMRKLDAVATIPYYTGRYGASRRGFGFVTIDSSLDAFHRKTMATEQVINELIDATLQELKKNSSENSQAIGRNLLGTLAKLSTATMGMIVFVILVAIWMASAFTNTVTCLIQGMDRFRSGERRFRFHSRGGDEMAALANCLDEMADNLTASVKDYMVILDLNENILYANDEALALIRKTFEDIYGRPYSAYSIFPSDGEYSPLCALREGYETEVFYYTTEDKYLKGVASYLTARDGEKIGYIVTTTDVSAIIAEQKKIEAERALLSTVFSSSPDIMWYQDKDGRYLAVNPRFASIVGKYPEQLIGLRVDDILSENLSMPMKENDFLAVRGNEPMYTEERICFSDGHEEVADIVRLPLRTPQGELMGMIGIARDVSLRVAVEEELRKTQTELEVAVVAANAASESKSNFLARMSHEIRTPMNAIIGMAHITKSKLTEVLPADHAVLGHVGQIEVSSKHLLGLLNDILDISKIEAGKIELSEEIFDLTKMADNVSAIIRSRCQEKHIEYELHIECFEKSLFFCDALRLRQVIINLLGNAVKFTPEYGKIRFLIRHLDYKDGKSKIYFAVIDTGIGIPEDVAAGLFTPFEQGGAYISKIYGGTGLGLSISRSIVKMMGSDIQVASAEGKGSTFSFILWLREAEENEITAFAPDGDYSMLRGKRILLVDDVAVNRLIVTEQLASTGLVIDEAEDGAAALKRFAESPVGWYDLVFMDIQMPHMDGHQASDAIRALVRQDARTVPIIAMTADAFKEDILQALAHGMNAHLAKPFENEKLMEILMRFLLTSGNGSKNDARFGTTPSK